MEDVEDRIEKAAATMNSREDFVAFLGLLLEDCNENLEFWNNQDLQSFLIALRTYAQGSGAPYQVDPAKPSWRLFADMLSVARAYDLED